MKYINNNLFNFIIISTFFISCVPIEFNKNIGEECKVNLHCNSGCCSSNKCVNSDECKDLKNKVYTLQIIASIVLVVICCIYLFVKLKIIKKNFQEKIEDKEGKEGKENNKNKSE